MFFKKIGIVIRCFFNQLCVLWQLLWGIWRVLGLKKPVISIFGGARFSARSYYARQAAELAKRLTERNISILTGGGPGIMEAVSCGAREKKDGNGRVMGINLSYLEETPAICKQDYFEVDSFRVRKWLLTHYSQAFVVFPGGFGTLDEVTEVLTLIQLKKLSPEPIILVGTEYWQPFLDWLKAEVIAHGAITEADLNLFTITDDFNYIYCLICDECMLPRS